MSRKTFEPKKYGMVICPCCNGHGYIQSPKRQCCPKCGGFGFVKKESEKDMNTSPIIEKEKGGHDEGGRHL
jgi:DnaJ-class molecular chaperone